MRPAIRLYCDSSSIVAAYLLGGLRRDCGELDVGDDLMEPWLERRVTSHRGGEEELASSLRLAHPQPDATVREEEDHEEPEDQQGRTDPDEDRSGVLGHDQTGELSGALEGVRQAGDRGRLTLVHDLGAEGRVRAGLVDLELQLPRLDVGVRLAGGHVDDVDGQPFALDVELADALLSVVGLPLQRRGVAVEGLARAVRDLYRCGLAEERLEERDAVPAHGVVDSYRLPINLGTVLVQDEVARVVTWGAVGVVRVVEGHRFDRQPGPVADLNRGAHGNDELGVLEAGGRSDEETHENQDEAQVRHNGSEGTPTEPVGIQVDFTLTGVGDRAEAVGLQDRAHLLLSLIHI